MRSQIESKVTNKVCIFIIHGLGEVIGKPKIHNNEFFGILKPRALRNVKVDPEKPVPKNAVRTDTNNAIVLLPFLGNPEEIFLTEEAIMSVCTDQRLLDAYMFATTGLVVVDKVQIEEVKKTKNKKQAN